MERRTEPGYVYHSCDFIDDGVYIDMNLLREYEDTGLTPEQIEELLSRKNASEITRSSRDNDGWIPVEERLPEKDGFYIATIDGDIIGEEDPFVGLAEFDRGDWYDDDIDYKCIIAWRPLPDPYRPERSNDEKE